ncbi:MAG TPA: hypothetical protein VGL49_08490 [Acidimicrobiales bacterium]
MAEWLSDEWLKEMAGLAASRPPVPEANGTVSVAITRGRSGDAAYHWSYRDGVPGDGGMGPTADADLVLTIADADARPVATGAVEPSVAYMRGRLKAAGDGALLLGWLASMAGEGYAEWRAQAVAQAGPPPAV